MRALFAGTVDQVQAVVGQRVGAGDPIATVVDLGSLIVEAAVLEHDLPLVPRGATATVSAAASAKAFPAHVLEVLPLVDYNQIGPRSCAYGQETECCGPGCTSTSSSWLLVSPTGSSFRRRRSSSAMVGRLCSAITAARPIGCTSRPDGRTGGRLKSFPRSETVRSRESATIA